MTRRSVVLDTNVLVSAVIKFTGPEAHTVDLVATRDLSVHVSELILREYHDVLFRPRLRLLKSRVEEVLDLMTRGELVVPNRILSVSPDESDNRFLECAEAARADFLVTGNKRHFPSLWKSTRIVNARELLDIMGEQ